MRNFSICLLATGLFPISALANDFTKVGEVNSVLVEPDISGNSTVSFWKSGDFFVAANNLHRETELRFYFSQELSKSPEKEILLKTRVSYQAKDSVVGAKYALFYTPRDYDTGINILRVNKDDPNDSKELDDKKFYAQIKNVIGKECYSIGSYGVQDLTDAPRIIAERVRFTAEFRCVLPSGGWSDFEGVVSLNENFDVDADTTFLYSGYKPMTTLSRDGDSFLSSIKNSNDSYKFVMHDFKANKSNLLDIPISAYNLYNGECGSKPKFVENNSHWFIVSCSRLTSIEKESPFKVELQKFSDKYNEETYVPVSESQFLIFDRDFTLQKTNILLMDKNGHQIRKQTVKGTPIANGDLVLGQAPTMDAPLILNNKLYFATTTKQWIQGVVTIYALDLSNLNVLTSGELLNAWDGIVNDQIFSLTSFPDGNLNRILVGLARTKDDKSISVDETLIFDESLKLMSKLDNSIEPYFKSDNFLIVRDQKWTPSVYSWK